MTIRNNNKIEFKNSILIAKKHKRLSLFLNEESIPQKELNNILNTAFLINGQLAQKVSDLNNIGINKDRTFTTTIDKLKEQFKAGLNILEF